MPLLALIRAFCVDTCMFVFNYVVALLVRRQKLIVDKMFPLLSGLFVVPYMHEYQYCRFFTLFWMKRLLGNFLREAFKWVASKLKAYVWIVCFPSRRKNIGNKRFRQN